MQEVVDKTHVEDDFEKKKEKVVVNKEVKNYCLIGIESIPDYENHYRLGIQFLRNFYTALDYESNVIILALNNHGLNSGHFTVVDPMGKQPPKETATDNYEPLVAMIVIVILAILITMGVMRYR